MLQFIREPRVNLFLEGLALGGVGLIGSLIGAKGQKDAADSNAAAMEAARQDQLGSILGARGNLATLLFGNNQNAANFLRSRMSAAEQEQAFGRPARGAGFTQEQQAELQQIETQIANLKSARAGNIRNRMGSQGSGGGAQAADGQLPALEARRKQLLEIAQGDPGTKGLFSDSMFSGGGTGLLGEYEQLAKDYGTKAAGITGQYDADTNGLMRELLALSAMADNMGKSQETRIRRDAAESAAGANRATKARAARTGMTGSMVSNQLSANDRNATRMASDQIAGLEDARLQTKLNLGTNRVNFAGSRGDRSTALKLGALDATTNMNQQPMLLKERILTGPLENAATGVNYAGFVAPSGAGMMTQGVGNAIAQAGGYGMGVFTQDWLNSRDAARNRAPTGAVSRTNDPFPWGS